MSGWILNAYEKEAKEVNKLKSQVARHFPEADSNSKTSIVLSQNFIHKVLKKFLNTLVLHS